MRKILPVYGLALGISSAFIYLFLGVIGYIVFMLLALLASFVLIFSTKI
ncbi:MAG: hypothetical protein JXB14_05320 [Candidatus Altiarchaeota archaeon]|nr:hypothetical protein [Candidatus Altiarchaeota archaeon]